MAEEVVAESEEGAGDEAAAAGGEGETEAVSEEPADIAGDQQAPDTEQGIAQQAAGDSQQSQEDVVIVASDEEVNCLC